MSEIKYSPLKCIYLTKCKSDESFHSRNLTDGEHWTLRAEPKENAKTVGSVNSEARALRKVLAPGDIRIATYCPDKGGLNLNQ